MSLSPTTGGPTYKKLELLTQVNKILTKWLICYFYRKQVYDYSVDDDVLLKVVLNTLLKVKHVVKPEFALNVFG